MNRILSPTGNRRTFASPSPNRSILPKIRTSKRGKRFKLKTIKNSKISIDDCLESRKKEIVNKALAQKIIKLKIKKEMSRCKKSDSTQDSEESIKHVHRRMLSREEEARWFNIHLDMTERVRAKVTTTKQSRFMGFFSPQRLIVKAKFVREQNALKGIKPPPTVLCPLSKESLKERVLSPVFRNRRVLEENSAFFNRSTMSNEKMKDRSKAKIKEVLRML